MRRAILNIFLIFGLTAPFLCGQNSRPFEAATIKPDVSGKGVTGGCRGIDSKLAPSDDRNSVPLGRCVITAGRLSHMMSIAFGSPLMRISGFPDWDGPNRFDIQAKVEDPSTATEKQLNDMLQAFLIERFKLSLHRETKEVPAFAMVVAKNGPKNLHPSEQEGASMAPAGARLVFKGHTMRELAEFLSMMPAVARPVLDMTGINGRFDFTLDVLVPTSDSDGGAKRAMMDWQTVISDVQEQLGLRFESTKTRIDNLIIDHAEKPRLDTE